MNYRTNEDRLLTAERTRPAYNALLGITLADQGATPTEPCTVAEVKEELQIDFADHDVYLTKLIKRCRKAMEKYCGLSLVPKEVVAILKNEVGNIELPYGPVTDAVGDIEALDIEGTDIANTSFELRGVEFLYLETQYDYISLRYNAGYTSLNIPEDIKDSLIRVIAFVFTHRADELKGLNDALQAFATEHRRGGWLL